MLLLETKVVDIWIINNLKYFWGHCSYLLYFINFLKISNNKIAESAGNPGYTGNSVKSYKAKKQIPRFLFIRWMPL